MAAVVHHLPPEPGVTEIRIHGVGGTTPEALLEQAGVQQVTGDHIAGMYRGAIGYPGRTVEAYSWGGLTARSRSRAFWVLLLPFCLINLSGWMVEPAAHAEPAGDGHTAFRRGPGTKWHEVFVQFIGICATALYVMWAALLAMNTLAFQCGGIPECRQDRWYLDFFGADFFADHPGRRVLVGLLVPLALLAGFVVLGYRTIERYDKYGAHDRDGGAAPWSAFSRDDQQAGSVLGLSAFWYPGKWQSWLVWVHVAAVLLLLAGLLGRAASEFETHFAVDVAPNIGYPIFWVCVTAAVVLLISLGVVTWRSGPILEAGPVFRAVSYGVLAVGVAALTTAAWLTSRLDVTDERLVQATAGGGSADQVTRPNTDLWGFGWTPILLLLLATVFIALFSIVQVWRWLWSRLFFPDQFMVVVMLAFIVFWPWAGWVALVGALLAIAAQWLAVTVAPATPARPMPPWRLSLLVGVCVVGGLARVGTADADSPFGVDWPRLTPVLVFTVILVGLGLVQISRRTMNNADGPKPRPARTAVVAIPGGIIGLGLLIGELLGRDEWFYGAAWLAWTVSAIAWLAQFTFDGLERWRWNGPAAVAALALAILMGTFSGLVIWLVDLLDRDGGQFTLRATGIYEWTATAFAATLIVIVAGMLTWYVLVRLGIGSASARERGHTLPEAVRAVDVAVTMGSLLLGWSFAAFVIYLNDRYGAEFHSWIDGEPPASWAGVVQAASWIALGVAAGAFFSVRRAMRDHAFRTRFGVLWDVGSFWPRWFHPFAPPAYAMRAVPELQARLTEIVTFAAAKTDAEAAGDATSDTSPAGPYGAAIVSAHSQGSVVGLAAVASLRPEVLQHVRLVTHGSPLARFYQRYFPTYFSAQLLERCARKVGGSDEIADGTWLNYWRSTDPIGDPVFGARERTPPEDRPSQAVRAALMLSQTADRTLPDVCLADPITEINPFAPAPGRRGHSGYMADPAMWRAIDALTTDLTSAPVALAGGSDAGQPATGAADAV